MGPIAHPTAPMRGEGGARTAPPPLAELTPPPVDDFRRWYNRRWPDRSEPG